MRSAEVFSFPPFLLDVADQRLWKGQGELPLRPKAFAILRCLAERAPRLVTREELIEAVWGKVALSEGLLRTHVHELRRVLGEGVIETAVGRGYRLRTNVSKAPAQRDASVARGLVAPRTGGPLVGRAAELETLRGALRLALAGRRQVLLIAGDAGVGKTALTDAFLDEVGRDGSCRMARGACLEQYGESETYLPILGALRGLCRGPRGDTVVDVFSTHGPMWLEQLPWLTATDDAEKLRERTRGGTRTRMLREFADALEILASDHGVVLLLEDLHWCDHATADLLMTLAQRREPARLLILGTCRTADLSRAHPLWRVFAELGSHQQATMLDLQGLSEAALREYLLVRYPEHAFPPELASTLHANTGGNALFVVALLDELEQRGALLSDGSRWLLSARVDDVGAIRPEAVRLLLDAQIGRLEPTHQRVLEAAGVAGIQFTAEVVAHALEMAADETDAICETLADRRLFLRALGTEAWPEGTLQSRYGFVHALHQHAAQARAPAASRRAWHRRVGERLEAAYGPAVDVISAELVVHFAESRDVAKAVHYQIAAADRAASRFGMSDALRQFEHADQLTRQLTDPRIRDELSVQVRLRLQQCRLMAGELRLVEAVDAEATPETLDATDAFLEADAAVASLGAAFQRGEIATARTGLDRVLERLASLGQSRRTSGSGMGVDPLVLAHAYAGQISWLLGFPDDATARLRLAVSRAELLDLPLAIATAFALSAWNRFWVRDAQGVLASAGKAMDIAKREGFVLWQTRLPILLCWADSVLCGRVDAGALEELDNVLRERTKFGPWARTLYTIPFVEMCHQAGRDERGLEELSGALEHLERTGERLWEAELYRLRGELVKSGDKAEAKRDFTKAAKLARRQGLRGLELRAAMSAYHLAARTAGAVPARERVRALYLSFSEGFTTGDLIDARTIAGA